MKTVFLAIMLLGSFASAEDPGPADRIGREIQVGSYQDPESHPFYLINDIQLKKSTAAPVPQATVTVTGVFDAQLCLNTSRPDSFVVSRKKNAAGELEISILGVFKNPQSASIGGICDEVDSPTYIRFDLQLNAEVGDVTYRLAFNDRTGLRLKTAVVQFRNGHWALSLESGARK